MGRIKSLLVKRTARNLAKEDMFNADFEHNKKILGDSLPSKTIRNKVAGYISRLKRKSS